MQSRSLLVEVLGDGGVAGCRLQQFNLGTAGIEEVGPDTFRCHFLHLVRLCTEQRAELFQRSVDVPDGDAYVFELHARGRVREGDSSAGRGVVAVADHGEPV